MPARLFFFTLLILVSHWSVAAKRDTTGYYTLQVTEKRIARFSSQILNGESDSIRNAAAWLIYRNLDTMLGIPAARYFPFDSLKQSAVSVLEAPDKSFRIFTFNLMATDGKFSQFGYLEVRNGKETEVYPLLDTAENPPADYLDNELETTQWYGALYYSIVPFKHGKKKHYLLIGYDGATIHSNKKVLDVLWFDRGTPVFGKALFLDGKQDTKPACRAVFEFHNESRMLVRYEEKRRIVVLDKLIPAFPEAVNDFPYYVPSGDYDYFFCTKKGFWIREPLENLNLGQDEKPAGPSERPKPEPIEPPDH